MQKEDGLLKKLNAIHNRLSNDFKINKDEEEVARQLELFLNYVVYGQNQSFPSDLNELLNKEVAEEIRKDPLIMILFNKGQTNSNQKGKIGEEAFSRMILKILQPQIQQLSSDKNFQDAIQQVIIGNMPATIINKKIANKFSQEIQQSLEKGKSIRRYTEYAARAGKIDIDFSRLDVSAKLTPFAQQLLKITATVKNYSDFSIHLENVNTRKAYLAIMTELYPNMKQKTINNFFKYNHGEQEEQHLSHLMNLYALTGYGQVYIDKMRHTLERKYAKYLMYNNSAAQKIIIRTTNSIIQNSIFNKKTNSNAFSSRLKSNKKAYSIELLLSNI